MKTAFFNDEWCYWHSTGLYSGILPVGGWVQVPFIIKKSSFHHQ
jgi:hypothetical protein